MIVEDCDYDSDARVHNTNNISNIEDRADHEHDVSERTFGIVNPELFPKSKGSSSMVFCDNSFHKGFNIKRPILKYTQQASCETLQGRYEIEMQEIHCGQ